MISKQLFAIGLIAFIAVLPFFAFSPFASAQSGTNVSGLISSSTTWTKTGSPYTLTGNIAVNNGLTLTIEPGVTINLNSYYIRVNGTLTAKGTASDKIAFNGGQLVFTTVCNGWNDQTQSGCILQNAVLNQLTIQNSNPIKIDQSTINSPISVTSSAIISNSQINADISSHSSTISNCNIKGDITLGSITLGGYTTAEESSKVYGNTVEGSIISGSIKATPEIYNNTVTKGGIACTGYVSVHNNYVYGCQMGIDFFSVRVFGGILSCFAGTAESNVVVGNDIGIAIDLESLDNPGKQAPTIQNNLISDNKIGVALVESNYDATPTIRNNNIVNCANYSFRLGASNNVDVSGNWWGTTDEAAISRSIYDFKNDFNLGTVTYQPVLTAPNPNTPTAPTATPTPTATQTPTPSTSTPASTTQPTTSSPTSSTTETPSQTPTIPEITTAITITATLAVTATAILYKKRSQKQH
jgi:hypothetical protein